MSLRNLPNLPKITVALSAERLAPYLLEMGGDESRAIQLYEWNLAVSGAMFEALGVLEVVVRNALHRQLTIHHGTLPGHWYDDPLGLLSDKATDDINTARRRLRTLQRPETPGRVVAELSFGFWRFLLASRYEATLWTPHLRDAFPNLSPQKRSLVYSSLSEMHTVRNRIAHHEPIHARDLARDAQTVTRLLDWIDTDVGAWATTLLRLPGPVQTRPRVS